MMLVPLLAMLYFGFYFLFLIFTFWCCESRMLRSPKVLLCITYHIFTFAFSPRPRHCPLRHHTSPPILFSLTFVAAAAATTASVDHDDGVETLFSCRPFVSSCLLDFSLSGIFRV